MANPIVTEISTEYTTLDQVLESLSALRRVFLDAADRRGVFVAAYVLITREIRQRVAEGRFGDPAWVARYAVAFAELYRRALLAFETGDREGIPTSWRVSFEAAAGGDELVVQDLFLGINAHINHDLPLALTAVSIDPDRAARYADHTAVNEALRVTTEPVEAEIAKLYDPVIGILGTALGPIDEAITGFGFVAARENAWDRAVAIANTHSDGERRRLVERINEHAGVVARLILAPTVPIWLLHGMKHFEDLQDWRRCLG